jgi:hypothetical protein
MIQSRAIEKMADAHRHDLMEAARVHSLSRPRNRQNFSEGTSEVATRHSATGLPVSGGRVAGRPRGNRLGTWLIQAGTRLGGASISPS